MAIFQNSIVTRPAASYEIPYSGDFSGSSDVLYRTPSSASNRKTWTKSFWMKIGATGDGVIIGGNGGFDVMRFQASNKILLRFGASADRVTTATHTDTSNWIHYCLGSDTTQGVAANRAKFEVNGTAITSFSPDTLPGLNAETSYWNNTLVNVIGAESGGSQGHNALYAEIVLIDGLMLSASTFRDSSTGLPIDPTGLTYGTNGALLQFASSGAQGDDTSGNGNDWTNSGVSQSSDTPTS
tara:strand:- start:394 stop:1113 length:720 start_codon:yes stop_codon:yes gene_type:complete